MFIGCVLEDESIVLTNIDEVLYINYDKKNSCTTIVWKNGQKPLVVTGNDAETFMQELAKFHTPE